MVPRPIVAHLTAGVTGRGDSAGSGEFGRGPCLRTTRKVPLDGFNLAVDDPLSGAEH